MKNTKRLFFALAGLALQLVPSHGEIIFSDNFDGAASGLNGVAPDQRPGTETWVSSNQFRADGTFEGGPGSSNGGSATLAFTPAQGVIYTIDASVTLATINAGSFLGFGFTDGQSTTVSSGTRFNGGAVPGRAWSFYRNNTNNPSAFMDGTASGGVWSNWTDIDEQSVDMRIVLDTTGGDGTWTATWYYKYPADETYIEARATTALLTESITSVGFCVSGDNADGTIHSFTLSDNQAPTPPVLVSTNPADDATGVSPDTNLVANFNKPIQLGATGDFTIRNLTTATDTVISLPGPDADGTLTVGGSQLTIDPAAALGVPGDEIVIEISAGAIESSQAVAFGGLLETDDPNWSFTIDDIPPTLNYFHPAPGSDEAPLDGALFIVFNESPVIGSGNLTIHRADDTLVETIDVTSGNVSISGSRVTITPTVPLAYDTSYYVLIDTGAFTDELDNGFGITDPAEWIFTTISNDPAVLFGDSFNRANDTDLNASAKGKYGSLGALNYTSAVIGVGNVQLSDGQLLAQGNEPDGNAGGLVYINDHNFTDDAIASAGGFSISVDLNAYATQGSGRYLSVGVGQSLAELDAQNSAAPTGAGTVADLMVSYRFGTGNLEFFKNGVRDAAATTSGQTGPPTKMRIEYSLSNFNAASTVNYEVFFDDSATSIASGSFTWSGADENYVSLSSNLFLSGTAGVRNALFDNLLIRTLGGGGASGFDSWKTTNNATGQTLDDDHDGDGVSNGVEYFIGGPNGDTTGFTALPGVVNDGGTLSVTFTKAADYAGVYGTDFVVEVSSTLESWGPSPEGTVTFPSATEVKYTFPAGSRNFARLKVTGP